MFEQQLGYPISIAINNSNASKQGQCNAQRGCIKTCGLGNRFRPAPCRQIQARPITCSRTPSPVIKNAPVQMRDLRNFPVLRRDAIDLRNDAINLRSNVKKDAKNLRKDVKRDAKNFRKDVKNDAKNLRKGVNNFSVLMSDFARHPWQQSYDAWESAWLNFRNRSQAWANSKTNNKTSNKTTSKTSNKTTSKTSNQTSNQTTSNTTGSSGAPVCEISQPGQASPVSLGVPGVPSVSTVMEPTPKDGLFGIKSLCGEEIPGDCGPNSINRESFEHPVYMNKGTGAIYVFPDPSTEFPMAVGEIYEKQLRMTGGTLDDNSDVLENTAHDDSKFEGKFGYYCSGGCP